jgi:hypothetical protein
MVKDGSRWRRIHEDGAEWEARVVPSPGQTEAAPGADEEVLEFVCVDGSRRARQVAVAPGSYEAMDETALRHAFMKARPIGGDHYGRPGKRMDDAR